MYKSTHSNHDFLTRTASHSTKGSRRGVVGVLPPEASREEEIEYRSLADQLDELLAQRNAMEGRIVELNKRMEKTLPYDTYQDLSAERKALGLQMLQLGARIAEFKGDVIGKGELSFARVFMGAAKMTLPHEQFMKLINETEKFLGRQQHEYKRSPPTTDGDRKRKHRKDARKKCEAFVRVLKHKDRQAEERLKTKQLQRQFRESDSLG